MKGSWHPATVIILAVAAAALGQVYQGPYGGTLDANYGVRSLGVNSIRQANRALDGNFLITGQVTGGFQFRGTVGYPGADQFRTELPSAGLDNFIRSSTGLDRVMSGSIYGPSTYFSRARTVVGTGGIVRGMNVPGTSIPRATYVPSPQARRLYDSAVQVYKPILGSLSNRYQTNPLIRPLTPLAEAGAMAAVRPNVIGAAGAVRPTASPLFGILRRQDQDRLAEELTAEGGLTWPRGPGEPMDTRLPPRLPRPEELPVPEETPAEALPRPGQDVLLDMLRELERARQAEARQGVEGPRLRPPSARRGLEKRTERRGRLQAEPEERAVDRVRDRLVLRRLAGSSRDMFNVHMSRAEKALSAGKFYEAARHYEIAVVLNRANPLAHLGWALALFAANEPHSSAFHLRDAMKRLPPLMTTGVDLNRLLGRKIVETRIEQLEGRLAEQGHEAGAPRLFLAAFIRSAKGEPEKAIAHARKLKERSRDRIHRAYAEVLLKGRVGRKEPDTKTAP